MSGFGREEDVREVRSDLTVVRDLLTEIGIELARKPNTDALGGMIATAIGVALAISAISFAVADWVARAT